MSVATMDTKSKLTAALHTKEEMNQIATEIRNDTSSSSGGKESDQVSTHDSVTSSLPTTTTTSTNFTLLQKHFNEQKRKDDATISSNSQFSIHDFEQQRVRARKVKEEVMSRQMSNQRERNNHYAGRGGLIRHNNIFKIL